MKMFSKNHTSGVFNIAHRGARSLAPENTIAAARKALELGADMWELDVGMTADGELIVIHDTTLNRTSNAKEVFPKRRPWRVHDFTLDEIRRLDFGSWFRRKDPFKQIADGNVLGHDLEAYRNEPAPTLREALLFTLENDWLVNVEIKDMSDTAGHIVIVDKVMALIEDLTMFDRVLLSSFNHSYLQRARAFNTQTRIGALVYLPHQNPASLLRELGAWSYHPRLSAIRRRDIGFLRDKGYEVLVWVVNNPKTMRNLINSGVSGIFTDFPQSLQSLV